MAGLSLSFMPGAIGATPVAPPEGDFLMPFWLPDDILFLEDTAEDWDRLLSWEAESCCCSCCCFLMTCFLACEIER